MATIQRITPHLWFDNQAEEAAKFYTAIFKNSGIGSMTRYGHEGREIHGREAGSVMTVEFALEGQQFIALNGGPVFRFTPAISFFVSCDTKEEVDELFGKLADGGAILMPLQAYPFSERFGWVQDKYGLSWQLMLGSRTQKIAPFLLFVGKQHGKAEEAIRFYTSVFPNSRVEHIQRHDGQQEPAGTVAYAVFTLDGQDFMAMESAMEHAFTFNEAISLLVTCETQQEVDYYWNKLSADPSAEQCGWLKDRYGVSWQIVPTVVSELLSDPNTERTERVMKALLQMKKLDIAALRRAYEGEYTR
ncbi:MAG TPA: VOC family protein [Caldilineaceae bacterium]|nr:VOC family protein [Caldilineaceae bacterium]